MTNPSRAYSNRAILTNDEVDGMLKKADSLPQYYGLRAKCLISIFKKTGKRRGEVARLKRADLQKIGHTIEISFTLEKKRKLGFFQYLRFLEAQVRKGSLGAEALVKSMPDLQKEWRTWQESEAGHKLKAQVALKSISVHDRYAKPILDYLSYMDEHHPNLKYLFPSGVSVFGITQVFSNDEHLSGRQLLRIIKPLNPTAWPHLFRETLGGTVARAHGRNLDSVFAVKDTLDLTNESTAFAYIKRYCAQEVPVEA